MNYTQEFYSRITNIYRLLPILGLLIIQSCDSIIAEDISGDAITILAPQENTIFQEGSINFKWESIENAEQYRIQIVEPSFVGANSFVIDSVVTSNEASFTLTPNNYQWRIRGENNVFETTYSEPVSFLVEGNDDLTGFTVVLREPESNIYTNSLQFNFVWENLDAATSYVFQLIKGDENSTDIVEQINTNNNFYLSSLLSLDESQYTWKINALNSLSNTEFSFRQFYVDLTAPNAATSLDPSNGTTTATNVSFSWVLGTDPGDINSPITTTIEIASDAAFTNIIHTEETSLVELSYTFTTIGTYFWRVIAKDEAGNIGNYSSTQEITVE